MHGLSELDEFRKTIENAWEIRTALQPGNAPAKVGEAVGAVLAELDEGRLRVAEKVDGEWVTHEWVKKAVLLSFRLEDNQLIDAGPQRYFDKVPSKFARYDHEKFVRGGFRVVPPAAVRRGSFIGKNVVLMPSYVNIGAYVDSGTMVDTWATVGSCAQIGKNVHLSGGVGIGGVLEPLQANPTIIEDNCFIGARAIIMPGVTIGPNSVVGAGAVVTRNVPPDSVVAGVPAKVITSVDCYAERCLKNTPEYDRDAYMRDKKSELLRIYPPE